MNDAELRKIVDKNVEGDISPEQHQALQQALKSDPPARATVEVSRLPKDVKVEIEAIAVI